MVENAAELEEEGVFLTGEAKKMSLKVSFRIEKILHVIMEKFCVAFLLVIHVTCSPKAKPTVIL